MQSSAGKGSKPGAYFSFDLYFINSRNDASA
jgi:hypothetical protein